MGTNGTDAALATIEAELAEEQTEPLNPWQIARGWINARLAWQQGKADALAMAKVARRIGDTALAEQHVKTAVRCETALRAITDEIADEPEDVQAAYRRLLGGGDVVAGSDGST